MIRNSLLLLPLFASTLLLPWSVAAASREASPVVVQDKTALQGAMETFKTGQRSLNKLIGDPVTNESALLETLNEMESAALVAIAEKPPQPEGLAGKELALFHVGYKQEMVKLLAHVLAMHEATLRADAKELKAAYDALSEVKKSGHQEYRDF